jgi:hypothetical protein
MQTKKAILIILVVIITTLACGLYKSGALPTATVGSVVTYIAQVTEAVPATLPPPTQTPVTILPTMAPPTQAPQPTPTTRPTATNTEIPPTPTQQDMNELIRNARVLVYEDVRSTTMLPYVHRALTNLGIKNATEVGDATGNFQNQIYSATKWDLIIVAAEVHTAFKGEMFDGIIERVDDGAGAIIELWYLDKIVNGKIAPLMQRCGLGWQKDLQRSAGYDPFNYSYVWLDSSDPVLSNPNLAQPPSYPYPYWFGDVGDLIQLKPGSTSKLIAGVYRDTKDSYGVIASCLGGRVYIQTICSHDYIQSNMIALWENYITNALINHFNDMH